MTFRSAAAAALAAATLSTTTRAAAAQGTTLYTLDPNWPAAAGALPPGSSQVTAVAVLNATGGGSDKEVHVAQRNASVPEGFFIVLDSITGKMLRSYHGACKSPHGVQPGLEPATLWVTDIAGGAVQLYDAASGALLRSVGTEGTGINPPQFSAVADVAVTPAGDVITSDGDGGAANRVMKLSGANLTNVLWVVGGEGAAPGQFSSPHSLAFEPGSSRVVVADRGNARVQFLDAESGLVLGQWALEADCGLPTGAAPWGVRVDAANGRLVAVDGALSYLYVFALPADKPGSAPPACKVLQATPYAPAGSKPHLVALDPDTGDAYVPLVGTPPGVVRFVRTG